VSKKRSRIITFIILIIGLTIGGGLIFGQVKYNENLEKQEKLEQQELEDKEVEMGILKKEINSLRAKKNDEFMKNGLSEEYYNISGEIEEKQKRINKIDTELFFEDHEFDFGVPTLLILGIIVIIGTFIIALVYYSVCKGFRARTYDEYLDVNDNVLSSADISNSKLLKKELYNKFEKLLVAITNGNSDQIRKLCSKNMANSYIDEVDLLVKHNQKRVIKDIENIDSKIIDARKNQNGTTVTVVQKIKLYDYVVDGNNEVISGSKRRKDTQACKLVFAKDNHKNTSVKKCPNCGAVVKEHSSVKCEYCGVLFDNGNYDWYLVSNVKIEEK